jgi:hypothetical protein
MNLSDYPKLECPFERGNKDGIYQILPKIKDEYRWVWSDDAKAVDKIDGTNVSVHVVNGNIKTILNRSSPIDIWKSGEWFYDGIRNAIKRNYFYPQQYDEEQIFGELIGPKLQGNPYKLEEHLWVPFSYLCEKYHFKFWTDIVKECQGKTDDEIFNITSEVFKGLWSIYKRQRGIKSEVNEDTKFEDSMAAEGIVFYNIKTGERCKIRRDMWHWYAGKKHKDLDL